MPRVAIHDAQNHLAIASGKVEMTLVHLARGSMLAAVDCLQSVPDVIGTAGKILRGAFPDHASPPSPGLFDLNREALREVGYLEDVMRSKGIEVRACLDLGPIWIAGDEMLMHRALHNLCMNASEAMRSGGMIKIVTNADGDTASIFISDSGWGMSADQLAHHLSAAPTNGHGYGLMMVQKTVEEVGGVLHVVSELGHGTTVAITMPRATVAAAA